MSQYLSALTEFEDACGVSNFSYGDFVKAFTSLFDPRNGTEDLLNICTYETVRIAHGLDSLADLYDGDFAEELNGAQLWGARFLLKHYELFGVKMRDFREVYGDDFVAQIVDYMLND